VTASARKLHDGYALPYAQIEFIIALETAQTVVGAVLHDGRWHLTVPVT
jgi:hypothetical protein